MNTAYRPDVISVNKINKKYSFFLVELIVRLRGGGNTRKDSIPKCLLYVQMLILSGNSKLTKLQVTLMNGPLRRINLVFLFGIFRLFDLFLVHVQYICIRYIVAN